MRIVIDDKQYVVTLLDVAAIVFDSALLLDRDDIGETNGSGCSRGRASAGLLLLGSRLNHRADIGLGEEQGKCAALPGRAFKLDFAAEQIGEFATDGQAE